MKDKEKKILLNIMDNMDKNSVDIYIIAREYLKNLSIYDTSTISGQNKNENKNKN